MILIKKYGNRRLYDTDASAYVTLDKLAERVRSGDTIQVLDAKTGEDLTQTTLTQIIIESRNAGRLLPVPLLLQLVRLADDALAEFFGRYLALSLEFYLQGRRGAQAMASFSPFSPSPMEAFARLFTSPWGATAQPTPPPPAPAHETEALALLQREISELKSALGKDKRRASRRSRPSS